MHHHGVIVIGPNCWEAMDDLYFLEKCCKLQVELMKMGKDPRKCAMEDETAAFVYSQASTPFVRHWLTFGLLNGWHFAGY